MSKIMCEAIYLRWNYESQDEYLAMDIETGDKVIKDHVNPIPMTNTVRERVKQLTNEENIGDLIITTRESEPPTGTLRGQTVGVDSDDIENNELVDPVGILIPMATRIQRTTENNRNPEEDSEVEDTSSSSSEVEEEMSAGGCQDHLGHTTGSDEEEEESNDSSTDC